MMVMPMTPNDGAALPSVCHHAVAVCGRCLRPRNSTRTIISTGIQVIRLITSGIA